jgi:hypothetical protein
MALLFADSFDYYTTAQIFRKWDAADSPSNVAIQSGGRNGTSAMVLIGGATIYKNMPSNVTTHIIGLALKVASVDPLNFFYAYDNTTIQWYIRYNADASLTVYNGSNTALGTTAPGVLPTPTAVYNYVEIKVLHHATAGTVDVRVNNTSVLSLTNKVTAVSGNAYSTKIGFSRVVPNANNQPSYDDFYVCDATGSTNNNFLGDVRIEATRPTAEGSEIDLTPSTGTDNSANVDDTTSNDETDYNSSSLPGDRDKYVMGNLVSTAGSVLAVCVNTVDRKDDSGTRTHKHILDLSAVESLSAAFSPTTSYSNHQTIFEAKPGGGAFTITDVNNLEAGIELTT